MKVPRLVVIGSSNTDLVLTCPRLPRPGETLLGGEFAQHHGGKGANQAVACARAGAHVTFVGVHGGDDFGRNAKAALRKEGIDVRYFIERHGAPSGVALILLGGKTRENLIGVARSANDSLNEDDIVMAEPAIRRADVVVAQLEVPLPAVIAAAELAAKHVVPFVLNPAPARRLPQRLLRLVRLLTPNQSEAELMSGLHTPREAGQELRRRGCSQVVITLGARGALLCDEEGEELVRAARVKPVDSVGAGDCFTGWLAVGLAEGLSLRQATERAVRAAAICVTRPGAQAAMPERKAVSPFR